MTTTMTAPTTLGLIMSKIDDAYRRWRNLSEVLDRLGLNAALLAHGRLAGGLRSAVCTCQSCDNDELCQAWLVRAPGWLEEAPPFCPNAELFACERAIAYGGIHGSEQLQHDADFITKVVDDLCSDFGRSDAVFCEGDRRKNC